jgi:DNA-binding NarL/FixJ family response regulator
MPEGLITDCTVLGVGLTEESKALVTVALPKCHLLECELNSSQLVEFCEVAGPAILLVDYESLLRLKGQQIPAITNLSTVQILVLSQSCSESVYRTTLAAGCAGVLPLNLPTSPIDNLRKAIKAMNEGELWYPRAVLSALARGSILSMHGSHKKLTARETEILRLLRMDQKNQAIADQLFISRETVRWHLRALYSKLGVSSRDEARRFATDLSDRNIRPN